MLHLKLLLYTKMSHLPATYPLADDARSTATHHVVTSPSTLAFIRFADAWQDSHPQLFQDARGDDAGRVDVEAVHVEVDVALPALDAVVPVQGGDSVQLEPDDGSDAEQVDVEVHDLVVAHEPAEHDDDAGLGVVAVAAEDGADDDAAQANAGEDEEEGDMVHDEPVLVHTEAEVPVHA